MKIHLWLRLGLAAWLLAGCEPANVPLPKTTVPQVFATAAYSPTSSPTRTPTASATARPSPIPSLTPLPPTPTSLPTATPHPSLSAQGPHLMLSLGSNAFVLLDADGKGRREVHLPAEARDVSDFRNLISPDGQWVAYHAGDPGMTDVTLNLWNLTTGLTETIATVLPVDYLKNVSALAEALSKLSKYEPTDTTWTGLAEYDWSQLAADYYLNQTVAWSPDSQQLTFGAQIHGASLDVYLFDLHKHSFRQLAEDPLNASSIKWSPDGRWILYQNSLTDSRLCWHHSLHRLNPAGWTIKNPPPLLPDNFWNFTFWSFAEWAGPSSQFITSSKDCFVVNLDLLDVNTGQVKRVWPYWVEDYVINIEEKQVLVSYIRNFKNVKLPDGLYLVNFSGDYRKLSEQTIFHPAFWANPKFPYLAADHQSVYAIGEDGTQMQISERPLDLYVSPDKRWVIATDLDGMDVINVNGKLIRSVEGKRVIKIVWRPDSQGLFFSTQDKNLYYLGITLLRRS